MPIRKIVRIAFLSAILTVAMMAIKPLPNIELISLLVIVYALLFGKDTFIIVTVFSLIEGLIWGFGLWWVSYLYVWPLLCLIVILLKRFIKEEFLVWAVVSGIFGLCFGTLFALVYLPVDPAYAFSYWIAGLPWDVWHGVWNFVLMAAVGKPIYRVLKKFKD
ncbi:MAG: hypothetical protein FWG91_02690 [Lachnospiraceae bacterium]|nr:hypothetical protein [Lachnospiraceae bacterium]